VPHNISTILIFFNELVELITTSEQRNGFTYLKKIIKLDVPEAVIQESIGDVQETKYSIRVAATRYGLPYNTLLQNLKKNQQW